MWSTEYTIVVICCTCVEFLCIPSRCVETENYHHSYSRMGQLQFLPMGGSGASYLRLLTGEDVLHRDGDRVKMQ